MGVMKREIRETRPYRGWRECVWALRTGSLEKACARISFLAGQEQRPGII